VNDDGENLIFLIESRNFIIIIFILLSNRIKKNNNEKKQKKNCTLKQANKISPPWAHLRHLRVTSLF